MEDGNRLIESSPNGAPEPAHPGQSREHSSIGCMRMDCRGTHPSPHDIGCAMASAGATEAPERLAMCTHGDGGV